MAVIGRACYIANGLAGEHHHHVVIPMSMDGIEPGSFLLSNLFGDHMFYQDQANPGYHDAVHLFIDFRPHLRLKELPEEAMKRVSTITRIPLEELTRMASIERENWPAINKVWQDGGDNILRPVFGQP